MGESAMVTLLTGKRKRWACIGWGLFLTGVLVLPDVDRSLGLYRELGELRVKLASRAELPERARTLDQRVQTLRKDMTELEAALVPAAALSAFKQDLTRMARGAGCRLRAIRPGPVTRQPLEHVLGRADDSARSTPRKPEWEVEEQVSAISIEGSFGNLVKFLSSLENDARILRLASLHLHPPPETTSVLILELQVKTFDLSWNRPG